MTSSHDPSPPPLPASLREKLSDYRRTLRLTKSGEALFAALAGLLVSYLALFALDRFVETPVWARVALLALGLVGGLVGLPVQLARWVGGTRTLGAVARWIARRDIRIGDSLLGVLALTTDVEEYRRSPELVRAAVQQGAQRLDASDLSHTLPASRHRAFGLGLGLALLGGLGVAIAAPGAARNALARWARPTADIERYTFTRLAPHAEERVVARFEAFELALQLAPESADRPGTARLRLEDGTTLEAREQDGGYRFEVPGLSHTTDLRLAVGDVLETLRIEPVDRPEALGAEARVELPDYLELPKPLQRDVRGGSLGVVRGARVSLELALTRELEQASWTAAATHVDGDRLRTEPFQVDRSTDSEVTWRDVHGLSGSLPFQLGLRAHDDGVPTVVLDGIQSGAILLHDKVVGFQVRAGDDFGVRRVGLEWEGVEPRRGEDAPDRGEKLLGLGDPDAADLSLEAAFHPLQLGIEPQVLRLRAFALDALPGRERAYSAPVLVRVMTEDEHMLWVTRALGEWFDEAVEVRDQEHELLRTNEELLALSNDELATAERQRQLQEQASAERSNARRLDRLVDAGSSLLAEAARNEQINSNTLDDWAETMASLQAIAAERMPSVAERLAAAAAAEPARPSPKAGVDRSNPKAGEGAAQAPRLPSAPSANDVESDLANAPRAGGEGSGGTPPPSNLTLASTTVQGGGAQQDPADPGPTAPQEEADGPTKEELAKAVEEQRALMQAFQEVAGQISEVLSNLEGSTFVKRLKALSRAESDVARELDVTLADGFGSKTPTADVAPVLERVAEIQDESARGAASVRDDLRAYVERMSAQGRDTQKFQTVQNEMGEVGVTREMGTIRSLAEVSRPGEAIAGAENLADELDRWAEILVGPG